MKHNKSNQGNQIERQQNPASAITSLINLSALFILSKVPTSSKGLEVDRGSASASLTIWILAPELSCRDRIVSPALPIRTPT